MEEGRTFKRKDAEPQSFLKKETDVSDLSEINRTNYAVPAIRKIRQIRFPLSFFDHKMHGRNESFVFFRVLLPCGQWVFDKSLCSKNSVSPRLCV